MWYSMRVPMIRNCIPRSSKFCPAFGAEAFDSNHDKTEVQNTSSLSAIECMEPSKPYLKQRSEMNMHLHIHDSSVCMFTLGMYKLKNKPTKGLVNSTKICMNINC